MGPTAQTLVRELVESVGLEPVDAHRSAFTALACSAGWTKARVGRYLGISRARVGQKMDKLLHYATTLSDTPVLTATMRQAMRTPPTKSEKGDAQDAVGYGVEDWEDLAFAEALVAKVEAAAVGDDT